MESIKLKLTPQIIERANKFHVFREQCKSYLDRHNRCYDKFTIRPEHDTVIAYITENFVIKYLRGISKGRFSVGRWQDQFDLEYIANIVAKDSDIEEDINLVSSYFYDEFDIYISTPNSLSFVSLNIDVKTAMTKLDPQENWDFLYPVVQVKDGAKDEVILLTYYQVNETTDKFSTKNIVIVGYLTKQEISECEIVPKGSYTKHKTKSQTDNYLTRLEDYHSIQELIDNFIKL